MTADVYSPQKNYACHVYVVLSVEKLIHWTSPTLVGRPSSLPNAPDHRTGANDARYETDALSPGSVHPVCSAC
jgi:hypothetical protein